VVFNVIDGHILV